MFTGIQDLQLNKLQSTRICQLAAYWNRCRGARAMPDRDDIELSEISSLLPYMFVVSIEPNPFRVYYRLAGTKTVELNGMDLTAHYLDQLADWSDWATAGIRIYRRAYECRMPVFGTYQWPTQFGRTRCIEIGIFPVTRSIEQLQFFAIEDWEIGDENLASYDRPLLLDGRTDPEGQ